MTRRLIIVILIIGFVKVFGQKSNLYQIFAEEMNIQNSTGMNEQIFLDKKTNRIKTVIYTYDSLTKEFKHKFDITYEYFPNKRLIKSYHGYYKLTSYWKTDSNGVNIRGYDKNGILRNPDKNENLQNPTETKSVFYENGKIKSIYSTLLFYSSDNKIIKTTFDTLNYKVWYTGGIEDCYYSYKGDTLIKKNCFGFRYSDHAHRTDTMSKTIKTKNEIFKENNNGRKKHTLKTIIYLKDNVEITESYIDNNPWLKSEDYYK